MAAVERDVPDAPVCPQLGLAVDRHTRFTFPHPGHRCYATAAPAVVEPSHQATYCVTLSFVTCDRYRAWQRETAAGRALLVAELKERGAMAGAAHEQPSASPMPATTPTAPPGPVAPTKPNRARRSAPRSQAFARPGETEAAPPVAPAEADKSG
jgi:hypothetical protein